LIDGNVMLSLPKQGTSNQKGQALIIVLCLLALGGLTIGMSLNYVTTSLKGSQILREEMKGVYAAGAGIEHVLWSLASGAPASTELSENINDMVVNMQTEDKGTYTMYFGALVEPGEHSNYLDVAGETEWDEIAGAYRYTITVTWLPESGYPIIHLEEVGARIPLNYTYEPGSAALFAENLSTGEPIEIQDTQGAWLLNWELGTPAPDVSETDPVETQSFYITGTGSREGHYVWVVADRADIGAVGEITGTFYRIEATATRPGDSRTASSIVADVVDSSGIINILTWKILN